MSEITVQRTQPTPPPIESVTIKFSLAEAHELEEVLRYNGMSHTYFALCEALDIHPHGGGPISR